MRSVYLSIGRFDDDDERELYREELDELGEAMKRGERPSFDKAELERLSVQKVAVERVPASAAWITLFRFFSPGISILLVLVVTLLALKALK